MYGRGSRDRTSFLHVPLQRKVIRKIAKLAEVDLKGIRIKIVKGTKGTGFKGYTRNRRCIELYEDAFSSAEDLANTLGHERCHVEDLRRAQVDRFINSLQVIESERAARIGGLLRKPLNEVNRSRSPTKIYSKLYANRKMNKMKKKNLSLKDWIPIVNEIYKHGRAQELMTCPYCKNKSVKFTIQTYKEGDATIFLECLNCKIFDHISRIPIPDWLKSEGCL